MLSVEEYLKTQVTRLLDVQVHDPVVYPVPQPLGSEVDGKLFVLRIGLVPWFVNLQGRLEVLSDFVRGDSPTADGDETGDIAG
jgi:hypothetical protein